MVTGRDGATGRLEPELVFSETDRADAFQSDAEAELASLLESIQGAIFRHPIATQAAFAALVAEGRRFSATPEGAALLQALLRSSTISRLRVAWEVLTMSAFVESPDGAVPSVFIDALVRRVKVTALEPLLARLLERRR